jgi:hypothetical protein
MTDAASDPRTRACNCGRLVRIKLGPKNVQGRYTWIMPAHKIPSRTGWCTLRQLADAPDRALYVALLATRRQRS